MLVISSTVVMSWHFTKR